MSTEVYREAALRDLPCPCNPECAERTATCKHDGSCGKYTHGAENMTRWWIDTRKRWSGSAWRLRCLPKNT